MNNISKLTESEYRQLAKQFQAQMRTQFPRMRTYVMGANGENEGLADLIATDTIQIRAVLIIDGQRLDATAFQRVCWIQASSDGRDKSVPDTVAERLAAQITKWLMGSGQRIFP